MNLLLLPEVSATARLSARDPRLEHVRGVLRCREGDTFEVGAVNGPRGKATITQIDDSGLNLAIAWSAEIPPPLPPLHLLVAMCRPATARKILTEATTLGVSSIRFFEAGKSDPAFARSRLWQAGAPGEEAEWEECLRLGAEQAFATRVPELKRARDFAEAVEGLPSRSHRLAPDVYEAKEPLSRAIPEAVEPLVLAFGPERGWNRRDREQLRAAGFTLVSMGTRVLRLETATTVALSLALGQWGLL